MSSVLASSMPIIEQPASLRYSSIPLSTAVPGERIITLEEVAYHDTWDSCWMVIYDRVYDVTDFLDEHPGGDVLLEYAGRDATCAFRGSGHSALALKQLQSFLIGELPAEQRIFRKSGGYKISNLPD
ncbi:cytochrome B5-like protein [Agrilus planipennis]|uniref:Cytochrome B5-like protein n=1 Tax=Agrilus planipennis TaxID=224129 RepID=A0A1W4WYH6_AGRPL|nr:cytochrome B5-like protein [Agrilus planipennis]